MHRCTRLLNLYATDKLYRHTKNTIVCSSSQTNDFTLSIMYMGTCSNANTFKYLYIYIWKHVKMYCHVIMNCINNYIFIVTVIMYNY